MIAAARAKSTLQVLQQRRCWRLHAVTAMMGTVAAATAAAAPAEWRRKRCAPTATGTGASTLRRSAVPCGSCKMRSSPRRRSAAAEAATTAATSTGLPAVEVSGSQAANNPRKGAACDAGNLSVAWTAASTWTLSPRAARIGFHETSPGLPTQLERTLIQHSPAAKRADPTRQQRRHVQEAGHPRAPEQQRRPGTACEAAALQRGARQRRDDLIRSMQRDLRQGLADSRGEGRCSADAAAAAEVTAGHWFCRSPLGAAVPFRPAASLLCSPVHAHNVTCMLGFVTM
jgi:hypothetical protein